MKTTSTRGEPVDFARLMAMNEEAVALGNASMNARGDLIGPGGVIVKRREQIASDYHKANPNAVKQVSVRDLETELFTPAEAVKQFEQTLAASQKVQAEPAQATKKPQRRIVDK